MATKAVAYPHDNDKAPTPCTGYEVHPVFGYLGRCKHCGFTRGEHQVFLDNNDPNSVSYIPFEEKERLRENARKEKIAKYNETLRQKRFAEARALMAEIEADEKAHIKLRKAEEARVRRANSKGHFRSLSRPKLHFRSKSKSKTERSSLDKTSHPEKPETEKIAKKKKVKKVAKTPAPKKKTKKKKKAVASSGGVIPPPPGGVAPERYVTAHQHVVKKEPLSVPHKKVPMPVKSAAKPPTTAKEPESSADRKGSGEHLLVPVPGHRRKPSNKWRSHGGSSNVRPSGSDFALELEDAQALQRRLEQVQAAQKIAASKHRKRPSLGSIESAENNKGNGLAMTREEREREYEKGRIARERIKLNLERERETFDKDNAEWRDRLDSTLGEIGARRPDLDGKELLELAHLKDKVHRDTRTFEQRKKDEEAHQKQVHFLSDQTSHAQHLSQRSDSRSSRLAEVDALFGIDNSMIKRRKPRNKFSRSNTMNDIPPQPVHSRTPSRGLLRQRPASAAPAFNRHVSDRSRQSSGGSFFDIFRRTYSRTDSVALPGIPEKRRARRKKKSKFKGKPDSKTSSNPMFEAPVASSSGGNPRFL